MQAAKKSVDDAQEKLAGAAAERAAAAAARDKEIWARDAEIRRLQSKVDAAESAVAARRAETERVKELVELREKEAQAAERSRAEASLTFDVLTQAALQKQQLAHTEELRSIARERTKDAARLSEAEAAMQALRAEIVEGGQRVAAAEAAAQEAREGAEVLLQQVQSVHDRAEGGTSRPFPHCIFVTSCAGTSRHRPQTADSDSHRQELRPMSHAAAARLQSSRTPVFDQQQQQQQQQNQRYSIRTPLLIDVSQELLSPPTLPEYVATPPLPPPHHAMRSGGAGGRPKSAVEDGSEGTLAEENKRLRAAVQGMRLQVSSAAGTRLQPSTSFFLPA